MASRDENESEILLGNKQLLAVFAVVALLLAIAFTGGYMLGKGSASKKPALTTSDTGNEASASPLTKTVTPDDQSSSEIEKPPPNSARAPSEKPKLSTAQTGHETPITPAKEQAAMVPAEAAPRLGQTFLQVSALTHTQAEATAVVLRRQKFRARIAQKPGTALYRVLVGPVKDAGDLSSTRDSLRKIGFREVIVQRY